MKSLIQIIAFVALTTGPPLVIQADSPDPQNTSATSSSEKAVNTVCPVSGDKVGTVGKPVYVEYQGKRIAFCCKDCVKKFRKNPDKYGSLALKNQSANEGMQ
jgi:YHS domain-containing protein